MKSQLKRTSRNGGVERLQKDVKKAAGRSVVKVGIQETAGTHKTEGDEEALSVADVASFQEFGTEHVPERSFIRAPIQANKKELQTLQAKLLRDVILGKKDNAQALAIIGEKAQSDMIAAINAGIDPANDQKTIDAKGSSTPLIDSGQMKQSVRYKVEA